MQIISIFKHFINYSIDYCGGWRFWSGFLIEKQGRWWERESIAKIMPSPFERSWYFPLTAMMKEDMFSLTCWGLFSIGQLWKIQCPSCMFVPCEDLCSEEHTLQLPALVLCFGNCGLSILKQYSSTVHRVFKMDSLHWLKNLHCSGICVVNWTSERN